MTLAIYTNQLTKNFPKTSGYKDILRPWRRQYVTALDGVDLQVRKGEVVGLLGPNGAGKTTLLKILSGLVLPGSGIVEVNGIDIRRGFGEARGQLMYVSGEERSLYWRLTGRQNLDLFAVLGHVPTEHRRRRVEEYLNLVGLRESANESVMRYSAGMRQRLAIARGLLVDPQILLLDEPTKSLDTLGAKNLWRFIKEELVTRQGRTILIATHNMEEAAYLCNQVAILHQGKVRAQDTVESIVGRLTERSKWSISVRGDLNGTVARLSTINGVHRANVVTPNGNGASLIEVEVEEPEDQIPTIVEHLVRDAVKIVRVDQKESSLSDAIEALSEART